MLKRHVFLSPHPDDVIWSCGGRILELIKNNQAILIITVFDGDNYDSGTIDPWRKIAMPKLRRSENMRVMERYILDHISIGLVDAALRSQYNKYCYDSPQALFKPLSKDEQPLIDMIKDSLMLILKPNDIVNVPLGLGKHIDHVIVNKAVSLLKKYSINWYEEFPYPFRIPQENITPSYCSVDVDAWIEFASGYRSQVLALFGSKQKFTNALRAHASKRGKECGLNYAERLWCNTAETY